MKYFLLVLSAVLAYFWSQSWGGLPGTFEPALAFFCAWMLTGMGFFILWRLLKAVPAIVFITMGKRI